MNKLLKYQTHFIDGCLSYKNELTMFTPSLNIYIIKNAGFTEFIFKNNCIDTVLLLIILHICTYILGFILLIYIYINKQKQS